MSYRCNHTYGDGTCYACRSPEPPKRLTDPTFVYTPSVSTDISKTFARIRAEQEAAQQGEPT